MISSININSKNSSINHDSTLGVNGRMIDNFSESDCVDFSLNPSEKNDTYKRLENLLLDVNECYGECLRERESEAKERKAVVYALKQHIKKREDDIDKYKTRINELEKNLTKVQNDAKKLLEKYNRWRASARELENFRKSIVQMVKSSVSSQDKEPNDMRLENIHKPKSEGESSEEFRHKPSMQYIQNINDERYDDKDNCVNNLIQDVVSSMNNRNKCIFKNKSRFSDYEADEYCYESMIMLASNENSSNLSDVRQEYFNTLPKSNTLKSEMKDWIKTSNHKMTDLTDITYVPDSHQNDIPNISLSPGTPSSSTYSLYEHQLPNKNNLWTMGKN